MKRTMQFLIVLAAVLSLSLSACAPAAAPTPSLAELQATAVAYAQQQIALTAAAQPTATQPPTPTLPPPIPMPQVVATEAPAMPTLPPIVVPAATKKTTSASGDPCNGNPLSNVTGPSTTLSVKNKSGGTLNLYYYLRETVFGCGYGNVYLNSDEVVTVTVPVGCYDFFGWITGESNTSTSGYACFMKGQSTIATIREGSVQFDN
jgi:hypothetical protein